MFPYEVREKIIISGSYLEHYEYEKPYYVGYPRFMSYKPRIARFKPQVLQESMRDDNVRRTRIKIRRLVNSNPDLTKFMTLTFRDEIFDLNIANSYFRSFIKRLSRLYPAFKYLCVPEFQKSGRVHYHLLCNIPFIEKNYLESVWGLGFCFIRKVDSVSNLGAYVCKYLGKANFDPRYFRKNKFFYSYNLSRPIIIDRFKELLDFKGFFSAFERVFHNSFFTKFLGVIKYSQYKLPTLIKVGGL